MIRKKFKEAFAKLNGEVSGMHDAAYLLAGFALLSTLLALVRNKLLAHSFGAGIELDIYYASFSVIDFVYAVVSSTVSVFILIPVLYKYKSDKERQDFIHTLLFIFGVLLVTVSAVVYVLTPWIVQEAFAGIAMRGYGSDMVMLIHILLLQPIALGLSSILSSIVQYYGRYFIYALAPLLYNIGMIIGIVWLVPVFGLAGLGYGVVLGALMHLLVQLPSFFALGFGRQVRLVAIKETVMVMLRSIPRALALVANQVTIFILIAMAGTMREGSIAVFNLAFALQAAPLSIIGVSYSTAAFPTLSKLFAGGDGRGFANQVTSAARHIIFWSLPIVALVVVLRAQIVRVIYGSGAFDWTDTRLTAAALALFVVSLVAQGVVLLFIRGYYAAGSTVKPLMVSVLSAVMTIVLANLLTWAYVGNEYLRNFLEAMMRTTDVGSTAVLMLPLAYSISSLLTAIFIVGLFRYNFKGGTDRLRETLLESMVGAFVIGVVTYLVLGLFGDVVDTKTILGVFTQGAVAGTVGIVAGVLTLMAIGNKEIRTVWTVLHHKFWKTKEIIAETDIT